MFAESIEQLRRCLYVTQLPGSVKNLKTETEQLQCIIL